MTALPENRPPVIEQPSQGEVQIMAALINLQLQIRLGPSLAGGITDLKGQATVKAVVAQHRGLGTLSG
jgi:hypothetical protein